MEKRKLSNCTFVLGEKPSRSLKRQLTWATGHKVSAYDVRKGALASKRGAKSR
jgi:hypothetical protein